MALTKAVIVKLDAPGTPPIPVMFNPPKYELSKTNQFAEIKIPGLPSSVLQFVNGNAKNLTMDLFFDTTDKGIDVRIHSSAVSNLTEPDPVTKAPPRLLLLWGSLAFPCFLTSVRQTFDYFNTVGLPLRATLTVEFKGHDPLENLTPAAPMAQLEQATRYVVKVGETLQQIAGEIYGDPKQWRQIATANNIDDPRAITSGLGLQIPRLS
jgi:Contractile injection system tube protein/LysM domain